MQSCREAEAKTDPEYGTITWAVCAVVPLTAPHVHKLPPEQKRGYLQTLMLLISGPSAAVVDPTVVLAVLKTVRSWLLDADVAQSEIPHLLLPRMMHLKASVLWRQAVLGQAIRVSVAGAPQDHCAFQ